MAQAFAQWIRRHPDDGRTILSNEFDWTYFAVEDVPFFVTQCAVQGRRARITLSDGSEEWLSGHGLRVGEHDAVYCQVKDGAFEARFTPQAQTQLAPLLEETADGEVVVRVD